MTARHFSYSPDTISRWVRALLSAGLQGLEPGSRRIQRVRQPQTPLRVAQRIQVLREECSSGGCRRSWGVVGPGRDRAIGQKH